MTNPEAVETAARLHDKTVLVTGGAGFIGGHIAEALVADNRVRVLDTLIRGRIDNVPSGAVLIQGDVRDPADVAEAMDGVDVVFHQAALIDVEESAEEPLQYQSVNVGGTLTVLEEARRTGAAVVLASSAAIYGDPEEIPVSETSRKRPTSPYGINKLAADHYAHLYSERYGVDTARLRYFNVYGPGQPAGSYAGVVRIFAAQAAANEPLTVHGDGMQTRDFVHVDDVVRANLLAVQSDHSGRAYNIGSGRGTEIRELAERVRAASPTNPEIKYTQGREGDIGNSQADISRAESEIGYNPTVTLDRGLETVLQAAGCQINPDQGSPRGSR